MELGSNFKERLADLVNSELAKIGSDELTEQDIEEALHDAATQVRINGRVDAGSL